MGMRIISLMLAVGCLTMAVLLFRRPAVVRAVSNIPTQATLLPPIQVPPVSVAATESEIDREIEHDNPEPLACIPFRSLIDRLAAPGPWQGDAEKTDAAHDIIQRLVLLIGDMPNVSIVPVNVVGDVVVINKGALNNTDARRLFDALDRAIDAAPLTPLPCAQVCRANQPRQAFVFNVRPLLARLNRNESDSPSDALRHELIHRLPGKDWNVRGSGEMRVFGGILYIVETPQVVQTIRQLLQQIAHEHGLPAAH